ncbi:Serine/Threonine kinase domain protein (macronuclear) [Tetrahymena thermophila SB210]|uniref:non-specific serine/threonine protein kinase n=1 Tax=Tetrahymena thermophila (strain SB210) TaxID=312017 RepID=Q22LX8_TETTS|nr:Serine/Threonine kinase domain protein [Tetrahymena thermophila SB210]EAR86537.2 Serine/Threonine kinase domain protein [Tetrahymena thermophila SB210]|eukprot:XP_977242.2 Serine/Threonine kinase domain protein [Tetrahymena thermophila SB210]
MSHSQLSTKEVLPFTQSENSPQALENNKQTADKYLDYYDNLGSFMIKDLDSGVSYDAREEKKIEEINSKYDVITPVAEQGQTKAWNDYWRQIKRMKEDFFDCVQMGDLIGLREILDKQNVPFTVDIKWHDEWTPIHYACNEGHADILQYLISKGADLKAKTSFDYTVLHLGSIRGSHECIKIILENDSSFINEQDKEFNTPLHYACKYGFNKIVELLLNYDVDMTIKNHIGNTPCEELQNFDIYQLISQKAAEKGINSENLIRKDMYNRTFFNNNIMRNSRQDHVSKLLRLTKNFDHNSIIKPSENVKEEKPNQGAAIVEHFKKLAKNQLQFKQVELQQESSSKNSVGPNDFTIVETLGKGAFGQVFLVQKKDDKLFFAMKVLQKERILGKNILKYALTERNVLSVMQHPFIVSLKYAFQTKNKLYLVMDYCPGGDLDNLLFRKGRIPEPIAKIYICEIILALEALHNSNIVFRDLKPSNVVLDKDGHACITDFGLAKQGMQRGDITKSFCGSLAYLPPEMLNKTGHTQSLDWYLLGVLMYELLEGMPPYYSDNKQKLFDNIRNAPLKMPKQASDAAKSLLKGLLSKDPIQRLGSKGAEEVKSHPFFRDVNWEDVYNKKLLPPVPKKPPIQLEGKEDNLIKVTISLEQQKGDNNEPNFVNSWDFNIKNYSLQSPTLPKN